MLHIMYVYVYVCIENNNTNNNNNNKKKKKKKKNIMCIHIVCQTDTAHIPNRIIIAQAGGHQKEEW